MKIKTIFSLIGITTTMAIGALVGLNVHQNSEVKEAKAATGYYLVGSGSFVSGTDWSTTGGIEFGTNPSSSSDHGALFKQFLHEGDIIKATDGGEVWAGWHGGLNSNYFTYTAIDSFNQRITCSVAGYYGDAANWWSNLNCHTRIETKGSPISSHNEIIDLDYNLGDFNIYPDVKTISFFRYNGTDEYNKNTFDVTVQNPYWNNTLNFWVGNNISWENKTSKDNIYVKQSNYYDIYLNASNQLSINLVNNFIVGDSVYLNVNNQSAWNDKTPIVHFWVENTENATNVPMTLVNGHGGSTKIYEAVVPALSGNAEPNCAIFFHDDWGDQTDDLKFNAGTNLFKLTSDNGGYWDSYVSVYDRANYFGTYFNSLTDGDEGGVCAANGNTNLTNLNTVWGTLGTEYDQMCSGAKNIVKAAIASEGGDALASAMARYDYVVFFKQYSIANTLNFIGRSAPSGSNGHVLGGVLMSGNNATSTIVVVTSLISVCALGAFFFLKKKKENN